MRNCRRLTIVFGHGFTEHTSQAVDLSVECFVIRPGSGRVEQLVRNALQLLGDRQVEDGEVLEFSLGQGTVVDGVDDGSSVLQGASLALTELAARPTGVDQPTVDLVLGHPLLQHTRVVSWVERQEGSTVTSREDGGGFRDTVFGTGGLGGVTGQEVVVGLFRGQLGDGRQDTESVATEHDNVAGLSFSDTRDLGVRDVFDGVGASSVFGDGDIVVIWHSVGGVVDDVLEDGTVTDSVEDLGLLLGGQVDGLGVTTTFNVEDTGI